MADIPRRVQIGQIRYTILSDDESWLTFEHSRQNKGLLGSTNADEATIHIKPGLAPDVTRLTLMHELIHAVIESTMGNPDPASFTGDTPDDRNELMVLAFEHPMLALVADNPDVMAFLSRREG